MELTKQEARLISRIIDSSDTYYLMWEAAYLVPSVALVVFSALDGSKRGIIIGMAVIVVMRVMTVVQQTKSLQIFKGLCKKIEALGISKTP